MNNDKSKKETALPIKDAPLTKEQEKEVLEIPEKPKYNEPKIEGMFEGTTDLPKKETVINDKRGKTHFEEFDDKDSEQVEKELSKGILSEEYVYEKVIDKDEEGNDLEKPYSVWGFSVAGSTRMAKMQKNIETVSVTLEEDAKKWIYTVIVKDTKNGISLPGQADELKNGENSKFARRIAMRKALRNAIVSVVDDDTKQEVFKEWYDRKYKTELNSDQIIIVGEFAKIKDFK